MRRRVFISSVIKGYEAYRGTARTAVSDLHQEPVMAEDLPASSKSPQVACLDGVRSSDVYLGIFGARYSGPTADEYAEAKATGKEILIMVEQVAKEPEQARFLTSVESYVSGHLRATFSDSTELRQNITRAVASILTAERPDFTYSNKSVLDFASTLRKTNHDSWLWAILVPAVQIEIISAAQFLNSSFQEELLYIASTRGSGVFDLRFASEPEMDKQGLVYCQYDPHRHSSSPVRRLLFHRNGFIAHGLELPGSSRDWNDSFRAFYIDPDEVSAAIVRFLSFAAALFARFDSRRRVPAFSLGFALAGTEKHFATPPHGKSSLSMPWVGSQFPDPLLVPAAPFTLKPEDLALGSRYAEEAVALFRQAFSGRR